MNLPQRSRSFINDEGELTTEFFDEYHHPEDGIDMPHKRKRSWVTNWFFERSLKFRLLIYLAASLGGISICSVSISLISIENLITIPVKLYLITLVTLGLPIPSPTSAGIPLMTPVSIGCTRSGSWKLENTIFNIEISHVQIANVGGHRNLITMDAKLINFSDYNIRFELNANLRFIYGAQVFGPSIAESDWPGYLAAHKTFEGEIVIDQTPDDVPVLNLEFQRISVNGLSVGAGDARLVKLGITSLSIPGIPSSC